MIPITDLIILMVLALLIFGPRRLPEIGRMVGKGLAEFRRASNELRRSINAELALEEDDAAAGTRSAESSRPTLVTTPSPSPSPPSSPEAAAAALPDEPAALSAEPPYLSTDPPAFGGEPADAPLLHPYGVGPLEEEAPAPEAAPGIAGEASAMGGEAPAMGSEATGAPAAPEARAGSRAPGQ